MFVGFAHELKNIGDALPITIANQPILILKNAKNEIEAFHNVCSHRCLKLVNQNQMLENIIKCPYHAWIYDLMATYLPLHILEEQIIINLKVLTMKKWIKTIRIKIWNDWIFINLNNNALPFEK